MPGDDGWADGDSRGNGERPPTTRSDWCAQIVGSLAILLGLTVVIDWMLASYRGVDVAGSLSFVGQDGWCTPGTVGLGWHCWGDYTGIVFTSLTDATRNAEVVYPMATRLVRLPFLAAQTLWGVQAGLILFLLVGTLCLLLPFVWALRWKPWPTAAVEMTVACVATAPFLIVLDRGNILVLAVPLLLVFLLAFLRDQPWVLTASVVAASMVKPQFAILALALLTLRHWRVFPACIAAVAVAFAAPYALLGSGSYPAFRAWLTETSLWAQLNHLWLDLPTNLSFARAVYAWADSLMALDPDWLEMISRDATVLGAVVVLIVLAVRGDRLPRIVTGAAFLCIACLTLPTSYGYYGVFALPIVAVILRTDGDGTAMVARPRPVISMVMAGAVVLTLTPLILPRLPFIPIRAGEAWLIGSWTPLLATTAWLLFLVLVVGAACRREASPSSAAGEGDQPAGSPTLRSSEAKAAASPTQ
jgi:hypothetical protein